MKNQTAVEWLVEKFDLTSDSPIIKNVVDQAKAMEKQQSEQKDSIISQIDLELCLIEDYAKGEAGDAITLLRKKINNYYKTNGYE